MKDPIKILEEEHDLLFQAIKTGVEIQKIEDDKLYHNLMNDFILNIRNYTETFHYPKEEQIFYPVLQNKSSKMSPDFIHEICDNHEDFKHHMAEIENLFVFQDYKRLRPTMLKYLHDLEEHLNRENKLILSVSHSLLSTEELESIYLDFVELDQKNRDKTSLKKNLTELAEKIC